MTDLEISERELAKSKPRIGQPCEHHKPCDKPSVYAVGDWYPSPGNYVYCLQHVHVGHGGVVEPDLPDDHPREHSLAESHKFG